MINKVEVITGTERRRRFTPEERAAIVRESYEPGGPGAMGVARKYNLSQSLVFQWRKKMKSSLESVASGQLPARSGSFVQLPIASAPASPGEVFFVHLAGEMALELPTSVSLDRLRAIVSTLKR